VNVSTGLKEAGVLSTRLILALTLAITILGVAALSPVAKAQSWPTSWILIDTDANEPGGANYRDVVTAYYNYDSGHLYLRLCTVDVPGITGVSARFKWFIDVGLGPNLYSSGGNVLGTDYLLFVEDSDDDGNGEIYLLPSNGNDSFSQYEPWNTTSVSPIVNPSIASYAISGNCIDVWISFSQLPVASPTHMSLAWATDQENPNLESAPNLDSGDGSDVPIHLDADLFVDKDVNNHNPSVGSNITYTVDIANTGPAAATGVQVTDLLPSGVTYQSYSATQGSYNGTSGLWSVGSLANGASATLTINATVVGTGTITNIATITAVDQPDPDTGDNSDLVSIYVQTSPPNEADLSVLKDVSDHTPYEGATITYTVIVTNSGPAAATNVQVTDLLPSGLTYQSYSASQGTYNSGSGLWSVGGLSDGASATLQIGATVNAGTAGSTINNTASATPVGQTDPHPGDNSDTAELFPIEAPVYPPAPAAPAAAFPSIYVGIGAALGAGALAYFVRKRVIA
jgi:uncharacterized repeat protein (TIGR01451 family)